MTNKHPNRTAGAGAYATRPHNSDVRIEVPEGTVARHSQAYITWSGALVHDYYVAGKSGPWVLGGTWTVGGEWPLVVFEQRARQPRGPVLQ